MTLLVTLLIALVVLAGVVFVPFRAITHNVNEGLRAKSRLIAETKRII